MISFLSSTSVNFISISLKYVHISGFISSNDIHISKYSFYCIPILPFNHENSVPSRLFLQWLCGNSYTFASLHHVPRCHKAFVFCRNNWEGAFFCHVHIMVSVLLQDLSTLCVTNHTICIAVIVNPQPIVETSFICNIDIESYVILIYCWRL